jgi:hypothetical protein
MSTPNTTPLTYNGYVTQVATMAVVNTQIVNGVVEGVDDAFNSIISQMLNYAELRIQRDLDLQQLLTTGSYNLTAGNNVLQISVNDFVTIQTLAIVSGTASIPILPVSKEFMQNVWGDSSVLAQPQYFSMYGGNPDTGGFSGGNTYTNILFGPYPDLNYTVNVTGTIRMPTLYQSATPSLAATGTTWISTYLPDLLVQASLIYISQFQRNFGPTSNDPNMAGSYEEQYENLLKGAIVEEARKRFQSTGWASQSPALVATPTRG